jgi:gamma-glutamyltranspeptidase/glutathione hydrolase
MLGVQPPFGRNYARSMVISQQGIAATSQALASQAGAQILAEGGSAADAAIAANATLGVVEPMMNGIGGDLFVLYWEAKTKKLIGLNASGPAPRALSPEFLAARRVQAMPDAGIHSVTVPGAVEGWAKMHGRFGQLPWKRLFQSAIAYAEGGFPVSEIVQKLWQAATTAGKLHAVPETARVFLPSGRPPQQGEVFRNPDLARAYRMVAEQGQDAFYRGDIGNAILATSDAMGGLMNADDLASFSAEWVEPISTDYRGWRIFEIPPNGQGIAALEMLNIMEVIPAHPDGPLGAAELHRRIEAMKLAYADVHRYNADPRHSPVPVVHLLSKAYAQERARLIDPERANGLAAHGRAAGSDTIYLAVVDREGNIASWIQSVYASFGSGITVEGMGFELQNRGAGFTLEAGHPNVLAGGKRPFHTIIPGFMERGNQHVGFGIMGGANQPLAHAQFVSNVIDYSMNLQEALEAPRFFKGSAAGCDVSVESRVPGRTFRRLSEMGHIIIERAEYSQEMGRGQAVMHDSDAATNFAGSDPRADGAATPEPIATNLM